MTDLGRDLLALRGIDPDTADADKLSFVEARMLDVVNGMSGYLQGKYPKVVFHIDNANPRDYDQTYDRLLLRAGGDDAPITVHAYETEAGVNYADNYYCLLKTAEYEDWLERQFAGVAIGLRVFATLHCMLGAPYTADYPVSEAADDPGFMAYAWLLIPPSEEPFDGIVERFRSKVHGMGLSGEFTLYRLANALPPSATKDDVFKLFAARDSGAPVYTDSLRVAQWGTDRGNER